MGHGVEHRHEHLSIMPLTSEPSSGGLAAAAQPDPGHGYAWWSGTSFAAATVAAELAAELPPVPVIVPKAAGGS